MSGDRVCITNEIPSVRSCTYKGRHTPRCDGWGRRYDPRTKQTELAYTMEIDEVTGDSVRILTPCTGCLGRPAVEGTFLCEDHVRKFEHVLERDAKSGRMLVDLVTHMWSVNSRGVSDDGERVASAFGSTWNLSESRNTANAVYAALAGTAIEYVKVLRMPEPEWLWSPTASMFVGFRTEADVENVAEDILTLVEFIESEPRGLNRKPVAAAVVDLVAVVGAAWRRFPLVDGDHRVPSVRCPECGRMAMIWHPPLYFQGPVVIECEKCGAEADQEWLEHYVNTIKTDPRRRK